MAHPRRKPAPRPDAPTQDETPVVQVVPDAPDSPDVRAEPAKGAKRAKPAKGKSAAPKKPYAAFPLTPHASGTWQKKIRGKIHYFGRWGRRVGGVMQRLPGDGAAEALAEYKAVADDLHAGRAPRASAAGGADGGATLADLCNSFLDAKQRKVDSAELTLRVFHDYEATTDTLVGEFGKRRRLDDIRAEDFGALRAKLAKRLGPVRLGNVIGQVRTVFKHGYESELIPTPTRFGPEFARPSRRTIRKDRATNGKSKVFAAREVRDLIEGAGPQLRAMILLGINCGYGNSDCARLPLADVDLEGGWAVYARGKTFVGRRAAMWPETVAALRAALAARPTPKHDNAKALVFVTRTGAPWGNELRTKDPVALQFGKLRRALGIERKGLGFYSLRHTFRTTADAARDVNAVRTVMGHTDDSIDDTYTHGITDARLKAVADFVRAWLYPPAAEVAAPTVPG